MNKFYFLWGTWNKQGIHNDGYINARIAINKREEDWRHRLVMLKAGVVDCSQHVSSYDMTGYTNVSVRLNPRFNRWVSKQLVINCGDRLWHG